MLFFLKGCLWGRRRNSLDVSLPPVVEVLLLKVHMPSSFCFWAWSSLLILEFMLLVGEKTMLRNLTIFTAPLENCTGRMVLLEAFASGKSLYKWGWLWQVSGKIENTELCVRTCMPIQSCVKCCKDYLLSVSLLKTLVLTPMQSFHFDKKVSLDCEEDPVKTGFLFLRLVVWTQSSWLFMKSLHAMCLASCLQMI